MFSSQLKQMIANKVQEMLSGLEHPELPKGEVNFILHIDGAEAWSWANIRNNGAKEADVPENFIENLSIK